MNVRMPDQGRTLATRRLATEVCALARLDAEGQVELDFDGVLAVSYSFADELLGRLSDLVAPHAGQVLIINASDEVQPILERVVGHRGVSQLVRLPSAVSLHRPSTLRSLLNAKLRNRRSQVRILSGASSEIGAGRMDMRFVAA